MPSLNYKAERFEWMCCPAEWHFDLLVCPPGYTVITLSAATETETIKSESGTTRPCRDSTPSLLNSLAFFFFYSNVSSRLFFQQYTWLIVPCAQECITLWNRKINAKVIYAHVEQSSKSVEQWTHHSEIPIQANMLASAPSLPLTNLLWCVCVQQDFFFSSLHSQFITISAELPV